MDKNLKRKLISTRKVIRGKIQALKAGTRNKEVELEKSFEPLTKSLKELSTKLHDDVSDIKQELVKIEPKVEKEPNLNISKTPQFISTSMLAESEPLLDEDDYDDGDDDVANIQPEQISQAAMEEYLEQYDSLPRQYIEGMLSDNLDEYDTKTGVRHDVTSDKFQIGNSNLEFNGPNIIIDDIKYVGTPGLYELLFKKEPRGYKLEDKRNYRDILLRTNAHKRNYAATGQTVGNRSQKYKSIIQPLINQPTRLSSWPSTPSPTSIASNLRRNIKRTGKGLLMKHSKNKKIDYVFWDNPNELVDRLRLLLASQYAGNNNHSNEIISIIEELKEANIIE